jgi:hypothetical protein
MTKSAIVFCSNAKNSSKSTHKFFQRTEKICGSESEDCSKRTARLSRRFLPAFAKGSAYDFFSLNVELDLAAGV